MRGRSVSKDPKLQEEYIKIYFSYHFLKWPWWKLSQEFGCGKDKIWMALKWVQKNLLQLPAKDILQGAIFSIERRLEENTRLWKSEVERKDPSIRSVVELNREIREDSKHLQNLQNIYREHYEVDVSTPLSSADILKVIMGKKPKE